MASIGTLKLGRHRNLRISKAPLACGPSLFVLVSTHFASLAGLLTHLILVLAPQAWLARQACSRRLACTCTGTSVWWQGAMSQQKHVLPLRMLVVHRDSEFCGFKKNEFWDTPVQSQSSIRVIFKQLKIARHMSSSGAW